MKIFLITSLIILSLFLLVKYANAEGVELGCYVQSTFENSGELQITKEGNLISVIVRPW